MRLSGIFRCTNTDIEYTQCPKASIKLYNNAGVLCNTWCGRDSQHEEYKVSEGDDATVERFDS